MPCKAQIAFRKQLDVWLLSPILVDSNFLQINKTFLTLTHKINDNSSLFTPLGTLNLEAS